MAGRRATGASLDDLALGELTTYFGASIYHEVDNYSGSSDDRTITLDPPGAGQYVTALLLGAPKGREATTGRLQEIKGLTVNQPATVSSTPEPASSSSWSARASRSRRQGPSPPRGSEARLISASEGKAVGRFGRSPRTSRRSRLRPADPLSGDPRIMA